MKLNYKRLGDYIRPCNEFNDGMNVKELLGISNNKYFQRSHTNIIDIDLQTYRITRTGQFAYNRATTRNGDKISIALRQGEDCIVSPSYRIFEVIDENKLLSEYLMMWFRRPEFDRYVRFKSHGSAHEFFEWDQMCEVELPIPHIDIQKELVKEYNTITNRITLNNQFIQKLEETAQAIYKHWFVDFEFPDENGQPYKSNGGAIEENEVGYVPIGWSHDFLRNITSNINRGIAPKYVEKGGIVILNQKCIRNGSIDFTFVKKHDDLSKSIGREKYLRKFDILINSTGDGTLGRIGLVKESLNSIVVDSHITLVRALENIQPLYLWFNLSLRTEEIINLAEGSTGQTELSRNDLGKLQILIPSETVQSQFSHFLLPFISLSSNLEQELANLFSLRDLLLSKLPTIPT